MRTSAKLLRFPSAGMARDIAYREATTPNEAQSFATPDALNMRGSGTFEDRDRGGSRPGLIEVDVSDMVTIDQHVPTEIVGLALDAPVSATAYYRGRAVCASGATWYMSAIGDPRNWEFNGDGTDPSRAMAGNLALATKKGESITALIPFHDTFLFAATQHSLWIIAGDPLGGGVRCISDHVGCVSANAWCSDGKALWLLSGNGLYSMQMELGAVPVRASDRLPDDFRRFSDALIAYSCEGELIHVFGTRDGAPSDWVYEVGPKAFWRQEFIAEHRPVSISETILDNRPTCVLKGADGISRVFDDDATDDCGTMFGSFVLIGPIRVAQRDDMDGMVGELSAVMAEGSADVRIEVFTAHSPEDAVRNARNRYQVPQELVARDGWNNVWRPRKRGAWAVFRLSSDGRWAYESMTAVMKMTGRLR